MKISKYSKSFNAIFFIMFREQNLNEDSEDSTPSIKVVMLGDSGVGKTSLAQRWTIGIFDPNQRPTVGAFSSLHCVKISKTDRLSELNRLIFLGQSLEYKFSEKEKTDSKSSFFNSNKKTVSDEYIDVDVFLWDTAGQEQYAPLSPLFLRETSSVILTVSCIDQESLENAEKWINIINQFSEGEPPVILAVNKTDVLPSILSLIKSKNNLLDNKINNQSVENAAFTIEDIAQKYPGKTNNENLNGYFAAIVPVSAESGFNVNALFQIAAEEGFDYQMNRYGQNNLDNKKVSSKNLELNSNGNQSFDCC